MIYVFYSLLIQHFKYNIFILVIINHLTIFFILKLAIKEHKSLESLVNEMTGTLESLRASGQQRGFASFETEVKTSLCQHQKLGQRLPQILEKTNTIFSSLEVKADIKMSIYISMT